MPSRHSVSRLWHERHILMQNKGLGACITAAPNDNAILDASYFAKRRHRGGNKVSDFAVLTDARGDPHRGLATVAGAAVLVLRRAARNFIEGFQAGANSSS